MATGKTGGPSKSTQEDKVAPRTSSEPSKRPQGEPTGQGCKRCNSSRSVAELSDGYLFKPSGNCPSWDEVTVYEPGQAHERLSAGHEEEWWEVLYEDIGLVPLI